MNDRQGQVQLVGAGLHADHYRAGGLHRHQSAADRVGQATGFTNLFHQPRTETGATQYLVADIERGIIRIMPADAVLADQYMGLLTIELDMPVTAGNRQWLGNHLGGAALGQGISQPLGNALGLRAVNGADQRDHRVAGRVVLLMKLAQVFGTQAVQALGGAFGQAAVGVLWIEVSPESLTGQSSRALQAQLQAGQQLIAQPLKSLFREAGVGNHISEQRQRRVQLVFSRQAAQADQRHIPMRAVGEFGAELFKSAGNGSRILVLGALVEHAIGQHRQAWLLAVTAGAGGKQQLHIQHRQFIGGHEIYPGALLGNPVLQIQIAPCRGMIQVDALQGFEFRQQLFDSVRSFGSVGLGITCGQGLAGLVDRCGRAVRRGLLINKPQQDGEYRQRQ